MAMQHNQELKEHLIPWQSQQTLKIKYQPREISIIYLTDQEYKLVCLYE